MDDRPLFRRQFGECFDQCGPESTLIRVVGLGEQLDGLSPEFPLVFFPRPTAAHEVDGGIMGQAD